VIDQTEWARISIKWLAEQLGGKGDIVLIEGFVGHPANEARMAGVAEVLKGYPNIKVVGRETGSWDQATGQKVMSNFLASLPNIDGIWTQDGMATGVLTALKTANPKSGRSPSARRAPATCNSGKKSRRPRLISRRLAS
jgi:ribose transport system substrate-binding protein